MDRLAAATARSNKQASIEANGNTSRGKYTLVTRSLFPTRLFTENLMELTKKVHGKTLTAMEETSDKSIALPESMEMAVLIMTPDKTAIIGIKIAHKYPIAACLYRTLISLKVNINIRSLYLRISLNIVSTFLVRTR